jgi:hypothetical protein
LDEEIVAAVRERRTDPGFSNEFIDVFDFTQGELGDGYWSLMPPSEWNVFKKLELESSETVGSVTDAIFQGVRTSANKVYVVDVMHADRIDSSDNGDLVTVIPTGEKKNTKSNQTCLGRF